MKCVHLPAFDDGNVAPNGSALNGSFCKNKICNG